MDFGKGGINQFPAIRFRMPSDSQKLQTALPYGKMPFLWCGAYHWSRDDWRLVGKCIVTKSGRNVWAKPGIKVIGPASFKSQRALPYQKMPLWCLARV
jgi:hypothetical protein